VLADADASLRAVIKRCSLNKSKIPAIITADPANVAAGANCARSYC
jgi:DNA-directed RNA polymerase subunit H (RpoH/RPB5)